MSASLAALDVGGSKVEIWTIVDGRNHHAIWPTADFNSFDSLLAHLQTTYGSFDTIVIAGAGRQNAEGTLQLTNVSSWPPFQRSHTSTNIVLANDVEGAATGIPLLASDESAQLSNNRAGSDNTVMVTLSTGVNSAFCDASGGVHPAETGHALWQPWDSPSLGLLKSLQSVSFAATIEDVLSGSRGFQALYNHLSLSYPPSLYLQREITALRARQEGIGPAITKAAIEGDECAARCMLLWGSVLGQYLRMLALAHLPAGGTIYLTGGIVTGVGVVDHVLGKTKFWTHFYGTGAKMSELMHHVALRLVTTSAGKPSITLRGALELARA